MMKALSLVLMLVAALAFAGCGNGDGCDEGTLECDCNDNGTCDAGLRCNAESKCEACPEGDEGCACKADDTCNGELVCQEGTCAECTDGELNCPCDNDACTGDLVCCEDDQCHENCCCLGQKLHVSVEGVVVTFTGQPAQLDLAALAPLTAMGGDLTDHKAEASSDAAGAFFFDCFDASTISMGLILLADDTDFDGTGGDYFPTVSGIAGWSNDDDKVCEEGANAFVMDAATNAVLLQLPSIDVVGGYIIGTLRDADRVPLGDATVKNGDGTDLDLVYYPNANFSDMGAATDSAHGLFIIPGPLGLTTLIGVKTGYTWDPTTYKAAAIGGAAYFVAVLADPQ